MPREAENRNSTSVKKHPRRTSTQGQRAGLERPEHHGGNKRHVKRRAKAARFRNKQAQSNEPEQEISLELIRLDIEKKADKGWDLYFLLAIEGFDDKGRPQSLLSIWPKEPINLTKASDNVIHFKPRGKGTDGETVFRATMPDDRSANMHVFIFQDKGKTRRAGEILNDITKTIGKAAKPLAASGNPYVLAGVAVNETLNAVGKALSKTKDKNRGYINLDEDFGPEFDKNGFAVRTNTSSTGEIKLRWRWNVEESQD